MGLRYPCAFRQLDLSHERFRGVVPQQIGNGIAQRAASRVHGGTVMGSDRGFGSESRLPLFDYSLPHGGATGARIRGEHSK